MWNTIENANIVLENYILTRDSTTLCIKWCILSINSPVAAKPHTRNKSHASPSFLSHDKATVSCLSFATPCSNNLSSIFPHHTATVRALSLSPSHLKASLPHSMSCVREILRPHSLFLLNPQRRCSLILWFQLPCSLSPAQLNF